MDMDFATSCPLVRPALPRIRFLFVGSRLCSTLPSDGPSRFRPCALLALHLHQVAQWTSTPKRSGRSDTQADAVRHRARRGCGLDPAPPTGKWLGMRLRLAATPGLAIAGDGVGGDQEF